MSTMFRFLSVGALLVGLLVTDVTAAPYDDYGFYLMDDPVSVSANRSRRTTRRSRIRVYRQKPSQRVVYPPVVVATPLPAPRAAARVINPPVASAVRVTPVVPTRQAVVPSRFSYFR